MKKKMAFSLIGGVIISTLALYLAFRRVPFDDLLDSLVSINYFWIIPSIAAGLTGFILRVFRWRVILESTHKIGFWHAYHPLMIGFMLNCVLPARVGELARPAILYKKDNIPFSTVLATVAAERLFDMLLLIAFFIVVLANVQIDPNLDIPFGNLHLNSKTLEAIFKSMIMISIALIAGVLLISSEKIRKIINQFVMQLPNKFFFLPSEIKEKIKNNVSIIIVKIVDNIAEGFTLVKDPKKLFLCLAYSLIIWIFNAYSWYLFSLGCPGIGLSFLEISAVMIIVCFFIGLPSVPGFWGLWEAGGVFALTLFGIAAKDAAAYTLACHVGQMFPVIIIGFISAVILGVNIWQIQYELSD
ncbi:MAG: flippase-like domain-containing protein [Desulfobacterales bacterium]|jgi:glycosyltransferase 2 family protein|nr:flippase-like domain-containing protein [Desulfobacterales bacterium]